MNNEAADTEWIEYFCMSRSSFFDLVTILRSYLQKQQIKIPKPIAVECQVAIFLYYISDEGRYQKTANAFGVSRSSVSILIRKVAKIAELIKLSKTVTEVDALTGNFLNTHGFLQCLVWKINTH